MSEEKSAASLLSRISSGPRGFLISLGVAIAVGTVPSILIYRASQKIRELTYYVHPARTAIVAPGQISTLKVLHEGKEIKEGVTTTLLAIWNAGALEIVPQDDLDKVEIYTEPRVAILEATVRKETRDVIDFQTSRERLSEGIVPLSWKILEKNDGASLQVIHAGGTNVEIRVRGTIKGQGSVTRMYYRGKIQSAEEQIRNRGREDSFLGLMTGTIGLILSALVIFRWAKEKRLGRSLSRGDCWQALIMGVVLLGMGIWLFLWSSKTPGPPFGF